MRILVHADKQGGVVGVWGWHQGGLRYSYANEGWVQRGREIAGKYSGKPEGEKDSEWLEFVEGRTGLPPAVDWWDGYDLPDDTPVEEWLNAVVVIE